MVIGNDIFIGDFFIVVGRSQLAVSLLLQRIDSSARKVVSLLIFGSMAFPVGLLPIGSQFDEK